MCDRSHESGSVHRGGQCWDARHPARFGPTCSRRRTRPGTAPLTRPPAPTSARLGVQTHNLVRGRLHETVSKHVRICVSCQSGGMSASNCVHRHVAIGDGSASMGSSRPRLCWLYFQAGLRHPTPVLIDTSSPVERSAISYPRNLLCTKSVATAGSGWCYPPGSKLTTGLPARPGITLRPRPCRGRNLVAEPPPDPCG
jgi:hypothetical protein